MKDTENAINIADNTTVFNVSHNDENGTAIDRINFVKINDNKISIFEKQASGAETYTKIVITKIY